MKKYFKYVLLGIMSLLVMGTLTVYAANKHYDMFGSYSTYAPMAVIEQKWNVKDEEVPNRVNVRLYATVDGRELRQYDMTLNKHNEYKEVIKRFGKLCPCCSITTEGSSTKEIVPADYGLKVLSAFDSKGNELDLSKYDVNIKKDKIVTEDCNVKVKDKIYKMDLGVKYSFAVEFNNKSKTMEVICKIDWKDKDASKRPQSVTVSLSNEDGEVGKAKLTTENNWEYVFKELPKASDAGKAYNYKLTPEKIKGYDVVVGDDNVITATAKKIVDPVNPDTKPDKPANPDTKPDKPATPDTSAAHVILNGADQVVKNASKEIAIRIEGEPEELTGVYVDDKLVDPKNYTVTKGSVVVTFHKDFIASLAEGKHTVAFSFKDTDEKVETTLTIAKADKVQAETAVPKTGDMSNVGLWIGLMLVLSMTVVVIGKKKRA